nr:MAG TPA: DNA REPAIR HELICASE RAD25, SSL2, PRE-INITIATION COMPLEX, RNA POLYMERASE.0A [Caudoviricetes sp.]
MLIPFTCTKLLGNVDIASIDLHKHLHKGGNYGSKRSIKVV